MSTPIRDVTPVMPEGVAVHTGFPNPAADQGYARNLSLDQLLIHHPSSTYFFRISGHTWADQGIYDGDLALVDRSLGRQPHDLVVCWQNDGFAIVRGNQLTEDDTPWGVIASIIHEFARNSDEPSHLRPHRLQ